MPYTNEAQQAKFHVMEKEGKISKQTVKEWDAETKKHGYKEDFSKHFHRIARGKK